MKVITLASGSKGNCTLVESNQTKILIDLGISFSKVKNYLSFLNVETYEVSSILITHEHCDHIKGVTTFVKKHPSTKIYVNSKNTKLLNNEFSQIPKENLVVYENDFEILDLKVKPFEVSHDSFDCVGYQISEGKNKMAIATDLGFYTPEILSILSECSLCIVEANHDVNMLLKNPRYSTFLKARILSGKGHLSNLQCAEVILSLYEHRVKQIILAHLSEDNNSPSLAYSYITKFLRNYNIIEGEDIFIDVAYQDKMGSYFEISD